MRTLVFALAAGLAAAASAWSQAAPPAPATVADLPNAFHAATSADPSLARALADRDAAAENVPLARSKLLPQLSFQSSVQHLHQTTTQGDTDVGFKGPSFSNSIVLRQAIFRPRDWAGLEIGNRQAQYGEFKLASAQADLWMRTAYAWVDVLAAQSLRDAYSRTLDTVANAAEQEKQRFERGEGTRDSAAESAAQLALARARFAEASQDLRAKVAAFNLITRMNVPEIRGFGLPQASSLAVLPVDTEEFLARAVRTNPELAAAEMTIAVNRLRLKQAASDHLPTLDLIASANKAENDTTPTLGLRYQNTMFGVQLQIPLYAGGGLDAAQRQAAANLASSSADLDAMKQRLSMQFAFDWGAQAGQLERAKAALELVRSGREARRAAEFAIRAGTRTWTDLGSAEILLSQRESDLVNYTATFLKTQAKILSLLPVFDPAWERWSVETSRLATR